MNTKKMISMLAALAFSSVAVAETEGFKISGDFATSIFSDSGKGNGNNVNMPLTGAIEPNGASTHNDFSVDMLELNVEKAMGNSNIVVGIGYGGIFNQINNIIDTAAPSALAGVNAPKKTLNLTNAYFGHKFGDSGFSMKLGRFESFMGYETNNYMDNLNYTRSFGFNYTMPFFHTGVGAMYGHEMFDVGLYMVNSHFNTDLDDNQNKSFGVSASLKMVENMMLKVNYLTGKEGTNFTNLMDVNTLNVNIGYMIANIDLAFAYVNKKMEGGITGLTGEADIQSMALYAGYKMDSWGAGLRYEMVTDDDGMIPNGTTGFVDNSFNNITATGWYDIDTNARLKLEVISMSADKVGSFSDDKGALDDAAMSYGAGFMYRF